MASPLITRTSAAFLRSTQRPLGIFARFNSSNSKDIQHLAQEPLRTVENLSGAPEELLDRTVRIFRPARSSPQQGKNGTRLWRIEFDILEEGNRWENPLMGWASSSDYQQALALKFFSKEDAIRFAERQGWNYYVQEPKVTKFLKKSYADNYLYSPTKLRMIKTK
ncbi:ETC complex I subunit conserved region-domain-containing protein [Cokeromyces recurvatus]|uniref:ETC complex I subunit conserved region-domain-containing protein n=1 Tax=Cokeromyces recurvatus TaxID=90255 RepID=UPI00221F4CAC|nr:ETC complex I subunit conserved region-domain-containing protein [Cokeromyces recurvatus]KAI7905366.1 ETC complex I subunit conserved region-domain-containing protein [Cokeromyces recurvatus]